MADFLNYFAKNYKDAQIRFQKLAAAVSGPKDSGQWAVHSVTDPDLAVDWLYLPAQDRPRKLIVIISGVHGSESYAGSAIQEMFLSEILPNCDRKTTGYLIVHSLNPWGFKNHNRLTENKVNLNRNCSTNDRMYQIRNNESLELYKKFMPEEKVNSLTSKLMSKMVRDGAKVSFDGVTLDAFIKATAPGQFQLPTCFEFGGFQAEIQIQKLVEKLKEVMPAYIDVVMLDLHTGLGHRGRLHVLTDENPKGLHQALLHEVLDEKADKEIYEYTPASADGFYTVHGGTNNLFAELAADDQRVCAFTMEFGTLGHSMDAQLEGMNQFLLELQGTHFGYENDKLKKQIADWSLERSYPSDPAWRSQIVSTAKDFIRVLFHRMKIIS